MAKGRRRGNREAKKPKTAEKKSTAPVASSFLRSSPPAPPAVPAKPISSGRTGRR